MALNPPILYSGLPAGLPSEWFCLERSGIELSVDTHLPTLKKQTLKRSRLYVTTQRICVIAESTNTSGIRSFDIPLASISRESFVQPIFGCNYLECDVAPMMGGGLESAAQLPRVKLYFLHGGAGTFLRVFFTLMAKRRITDERTREAFFSPPAMTSWMAQQQAYIDPNDSSRLYLAQPTAADFAAGTNNSSTSHSTPPPSGYSQAQ